MLITLNITGRKNMKNENRAKKYRLNNRNRFLSFLCKNSLAINKPTRIIKNNDNVLFLKLSPTTHRKNKQEKHCSKKGFKNVNGIGELARLAGMSIPHAKKIRAEFSIGILVFIIVG